MPFVVHTEILPIQEALPLIHLTEFCFFIKIILFPISDIDLLYCILIFPELLKIVPFQNYSPYPEISSVLYLAYVLLFL